MNEFSCEAKILELPLHDPFGLSRGTRRSVRNLFIRVGAGWGEGAPIYYKEQNADSMLEMAREYLLQWKHFERPIYEIIDELLQRYPGQTGLAQAIDLAWHDAWGKAQKQPLHSLWNISWEKPPNSSFTIGLDQLDVMLEKIERAQEYPLLKIKTGSEDDLEVLHAIQQKSKKPILIDANEGWTVEQTLEYLPWLDSMKILMVEQPLPREDLEGYRTIRKYNQTRIPIFVDEGIQEPQDIHDWASRVDGINIKLAKCGGLDRARKMIQSARRQGLQIMLGCMIESTLGVTAAAHLAPLCDFADLDGAALLSEDPFDGMKLDRGRLLMPQRAGIGAIAKE